MVSPSGSSAERRLHPSFPAFELGADDYVTKPFPISVFQKKVSALLNRISAQSGGDFYDDGNLYILQGKLLAYRTVIYK